jgi:hypothetical protein
VIGQADLQATHEPALMNAGKKPSSRSAACRQDRRGNLLLPPGLLVDALVLTRGWRTSTIRAVMATPRGW